ncbi:hypothetical protein OEZ60_21495 [Defluviimonas sp. WL0024]|uniref:Uncharacterized protein n=1 Tax=Albidovulum salinarum TaxID=2984153 RepID=A0ABT2X9G9_9RHOB|nr:hypothetical protein [Defluviimonas sp. WL0024]MCU9850553.1 hypothetical protein [Defluviimonas sp. WL0024]
MQDDDRPEYVTTDAIVRSYHATEPVFAGILREIRELSKKKPEATMSASKVKIINRVLSDLLVFLQSQPEGKYLEQLDDQTLPQVSDALMVMVQFETALASFAKRHRARDRFSSILFHWVTEERLLEDEEAENEADEYFGEAEG